MYLKKIYLFILLTVSLNFFGQIKTKEGIEIEILNSKIVDNISVVGIRQLKVTNNDLRKVMIKTKINSDPVNRTKLSAFSLLDTINKIRYRLADYKGYTGFIGFPELIPFRKTKFYDENGNPPDDGWLPPYDITEKDYFENYNKDTYINFEIPINFGTTKKPKLSILYFGKTRYKKFTAELYFAIVEKNKNSYYELYYGDEKISEIVF